ncbi:hypothetical protein [Paenibacillus glacialis]|uniref:hypothetical protein n=1 Tax=Paenibacillus glacialis TaxID=494026 RepID=UPI0011AB50E9|nr:hypothetical protein [Paenibacillus glacialis]
MVVITSDNKAFLHRRVRSSVSKRNFKEVNSGDTSTRLSGRAIQTFGLKPFGRQECATLDEMAKYS